MSGPERVAATGESLQATAPAAAGAIGNMELPKMQPHTGIKPGRVQIGDVDLDQIFYRGEPVVTFAQIDRAHKRPDGTAKRNFNENKNRFVEGVDFVELTSDEIRTMSAMGAFPPRTARGTIITRRGYLKLVKSLNDDLAWAVFDDMVERYFAVERQPQIPNFADPAAAARAWADQHEARVLAERTKAEIGSRREATAMNTASQATKRARALALELDATKIRLDENGQYATVKRMEKHYGRSFPWRPLKAKTIEFGLPLQKIGDVNYDEVNVYCAEVWMAVYGVAIPKVDLH